MPIRIVESPEPLSGQSWTDQCVLVDSGAARLLAHELQRYGRREISGRSFLIAGHRGSGKTTMVANVILKAMKSQLPNELRPLFVPLHGPSLLPPPVPDKRDKADGTPRSLATEESDDAADTETLIALKEITLGLHRALATDISARFRKGIENRRWSNERQRLDALELAAQVELELWDYPTPARLRELWRCGKFLERGVMDRGPNSLASADHGQGVREVVAIAGVCEAYRRISGRITQTDTTSDAAAAKQSASISLDTTGNSLGAPLMSLLTGGAVGAGLFAANTSGPIATFLGVATALGASTVLRRSSERSRNRATAREDTFISDVSASTLDRVLPVLIERLRGAGLAPIFVVDELDKVIDLSGRMMGMVHHLKKFVAENAFFCFLTDRHYFECMIQRALSAPFSIEYTYFTHQLFIVFTPDDLHHYLRSVLEIPSAERRNSQPAMQEIDPSARAQAIRAEGASSEDESDLAVLPYVLMHRSQMHTIDLKRQLAIHRDDSGFIDLPQGKVRSSLAHRLDLLMQVGVEMVIDDEEFAKLLDREPAFRRIAHDAMYFLSRNWDTQTVIDLSDVAEDKFADYLIDRMGKEVTAGTTRRSPKVTINTLAGALGALRQELIDSGQCRFLFERVRMLARLIATPSQYTSMYGDWIARRQREKRAIPPSELEEVLQRPLTPCLLELTEPTNPDCHTYRWGYDSAGRPCTPRKPAATAGSPTTPPVSPPIPTGPGGPPPASIPPSPTSTPAAQTPSLGEEPDWRPGAMFIRDIAAGLAQLDAVPNRSDNTPSLDLSALSTQFRVISTVPAWPTVQQAMGRLDRFPDSAYPERADDVRCIVEYEEMLRASQHIIARALRVAAAVGAFPALPGPGPVPQPPPSPLSLGDQIFIALSAISKGFSFHRKSPDEIRQAIVEIEDGFSTLTPSLLFTEPVPAHLPRDPAGWQDFLLKLHFLQGQVISSLQPFVFEPLAWNSVRERIDLYFGSGIAEPTPKVAELIHFCIGGVAGNTIPFAIGGMSLSEWGDILLKTMDTTAMGLAWLRPVALHALGLYGADGTTGRGNFAPLTPEIQTWSWLTHARRVSNALFVRQSQRSFANQWLPSREYGILPITAEQLNTLVSTNAFVPSLAYVLQLDRIIVEMPVGSDGIDAIRKASGLTNATPLSVYAREPEGDGRRPRLVGPRGINDLFADLRSSRAPQ